MFCSVCGKKKIKLPIGGFSEKTGKPNYWYNCPDGCDTFSNACKYYHGDHQFNFFGRCKCGATYAKSEDRDKYRESAKELMHKYLKSLKEE